MFFNYLIKYTQVANVFAPFFFFVRHPLNPFATSYVCPAPAMASIILIS